LALEEGTLIVYLNCMQNVNFIIYHSYYYPIYHILHYSYKKGPDRHKLYGTVLDRLYNQALKEQRTFLESKTGYGRYITGDGATIMGTKFIHFLVHEHEKGVILTMPYKRLYCSASGGGENRGNIYCPRNDQCDQVGVCKY